MGLFVLISIDARGLDASRTEALLKACPVDIFELDSRGELRTALHREDECILCGLCVAIAPDIVTVRRRYGEQRLVAPAGGSDG